VVSTRLIRRLNGPRGSGLLALALTAAPFALAYSPFTEPPVRVPFGLSVVASVIPISAYGAVWTVVGVLAVMAAFTDKRGRQRDKLDRVAWGGFVAMVFVWMAAYLIGWLLYLAGIPGAESASQSYINAGIFFGVGLFITVCASRRGLLCRNEYLEHLRRERFRRGP
jgi:hypothetical protein